MSPTPDFRLDGKVAVVTGASRGIGEAIARAYAAAGARVVLASRKQDALDAVATSINTTVGEDRAVPIACHTGDRQAIATLFERLDNELGRVDVLVNNAATNPYFGPALDCEERAFDKTLEVNVKGYFLMSQAAGRRMVDQGGGSIVNIASINGLRPAENQVVYSLTKAAVISLSQGMARELGPHKVRVNAIAPGLVETRFAAALIDNEDIHRSYLDATPLRRHGQPVEIAGMAVYLASEASSFATGGVFVVDGGATA